MQCNRCGAEKPQSDFYTKDRTCKVCRCALVREHRRNNPSVQAYDRSRGNRKTSEQTRARRAANPLKYKAQTAVGNAVRDGRLIKQTNCEVCGSDFRIHGHHDDYNKPLKVRWLCALCHARWHAEHGVKIC